MSEMGNWNASASSDPMKRKISDVSSSEMSSLSWSVDGMKKHMEDMNLWLGDLPPELLRMIFLWVHPRDLVKVVPLVCKFWNMQANETTLWMDHCANRGLDASTVPGGVTDWRRYYFTPKFTLQSKKQDRATVENNCITWKGQGTVVSSEELPTTGVVQWQVRVVKNDGASWVCFGIIEPKHVTGDGDWFPSYSFCTCCDGYPKGSPRWTGQARGKAQAGDVFTCTADMTEGKITIVGPRGVNMTRALPQAKYVLYFTLSTRNAELAIENPFYCSSKSALAQQTAGGPPVKKAKKAPLCIEWQKSVKRAEQQMMDDELWIGDLPPELLSMIMEWVPAKPLVKVVPLVCKFWNVSANNDMLWTKLCARRGLDASTVIGGVTDWRRYYFTPQFTLVAKTPSSTIEKNVVTWKGQGTVVSSEELPTTGVLRWQVRVVLNTSSSWVCFGIMEPRHVRGDGDWMPSYSFCTCCDGYPKGQPRWNGVAEGEAEDGDVFFCCADLTKGTISIVGPRGVNMNRELPAAKYVLYFTVSTRHAVLAVENAFYSSSEDDF